MKIKGNNDVSVQLISKGDKKAEVIVSQSLAGGKVHRETRHLQLKAGEWHDRFGNVYL